MSDWKSKFGLDGVDLLIHLGTTVGILGLVASMMHPGDERGALQIGVATASVIVLGIRRHFAAKDRAAGGLTTGEMAASRIEELEHRVDQLESGQAHIAELEERLDFTERLLIQHSDQPSALPKGST